jgi:hypothetical protein
MTIKVSKPAINIREELADLKQDTGLKGQELMRADTAQEARTAISAGRKNLIINGGMSFAERGTSSTSTGCKTVDRCAMGANIGVTQSQVVITSGDAFDAGFRHAYKLENTGAIDNTAAHYVSCFQYIEAQDIAKSGWNYKSASSYITISFWIKSSVAGTYYVNPITQDGTNKVYPQSFSLDADTWTKVEKSFPGHADLTFNNDNGRGMQLHISPFYGTDFTNSSVSTSAWSDYSSATRFPDYAQNWGVSTGATWEITGVQLEVGSVATEFEHRSYGEELALCQRYYVFFPYGGERCIFNSVFGAAKNNSMYTWTMVQFPVEMRDIPTLITISGAGVGADGKVRYVENSASSGGTDDTPYEAQANFDRKTGIIKTYNEHNSTTWYGIQAGYTADAEL